MKIERVDNNTIKCYISLEEMQQYNVEYTDFVTRTEKAQALMHDIIKQAHDEVGYEPPKFAFEMQIMMVPEQGMVLTFSEKEPFDVTDKDKVGAFLDHLKDFVGKLSDYKDRIEKNPESAQKKSGQGSAGQGTGGQENAGGKRNAASMPRPEESEAVFAFASITQIMDLADVLPQGIRISSALYKMDGDYFLHLSRGAASSEKYRKTCVTAMEFGQVYRAGDGCDDMLKEHGECIIAEKALKKLRAK